ncbi:NAD(P)/FAD-dependent oxidoreductase [Antarctobacter jejuensis]|uniref:NAD(P)/FAD-dependent oxidoreductase n=1 Tax=Antarctobacter jejuensis TaxID=1439938 RepID=UPI003FD027F7
MTRHFRIAVAGAGPAGSTCANAYLLNGGTDLALLDRATFPRDKSCGDGLGASVIDVLDRIDLGHIVQGHRRISRMEMHFHDRIDVSVDTATLQRPSPLGYVVPRLEFDNALFQAARDRGAADFSGWSLLDATRRDKDWLLTLENEEDGRQEITAEVLIGADGPRSRVRRALRVPFDDDDYTAIAIRAYIDTPPSGIGVQRLDIVEGMPHPGYCWMFTDGQGRANVGLGFLVNAWKESHPNLESLLRDYCARLGDQVSGEPENIATAILPTGFWRRQIGFPDARAALIGDAGSMINPGAGEGIFFAMYAGLILGEGLAQQGDAAPVLARFDREMKQTFGPNFRDSRRLMKLLSNQKMLELTMRDFRASPDFCCDFIDFLMGVMPPARTRSLAGLAFRAITSRFQRSAA